MEDGSEPVPLAIIPPSNTTTAPHLAGNILEGIATGILQIQSESVSAALFMDDDLNE